MPVKVTRRGSRYQVRDGGRVTAKSTTRRKATRQARLLRSAARASRKSR